MITVENQEVVEACIWAGMTTSQISDTQPSYFVVEACIWAGMTTVSD